MCRTASRLAEPLECRRLMAGVTGLSLIDADTDQPVAGYATLDTGDVLNLATLPSRNLNVEAHVDAPAGSVRFGYDANAAYHTENTAPYAMAGNGGADF